MLTAERQKYQPKIPKILKDLASLNAVETKASSKPDSLHRLFPLTLGQPYLTFDKQGRSVASPLKIGVVFSGGQASGGHNVISGIYDSLKLFSSESRLFGFLDGPSGIVDQKWVEIDKEVLAPFRNQGGFDLLGSGRTKIESEQQLEGAEKSARELDLDGLVIIGGDDSNTNAAVLAEFFLAQKCKTCVIGVPKTIDGDLKSEEVEISFGFDTATKTFSETIGSICRDSLSAKKYYFFIKLMGRSASHIALECALQTRANLTLIGEEVAEKKYTFADLIQQIADMVCQRMDQGKNYGVVLIPEGIIEFVPEFKQLIEELNTHLDNKDQLTKTSQLCLQSLPESIQKQLLLDSVPHGNVKVSQIETERLFIEGVKQELNRRQKAQTFNAQPLFCGYEGRSCLPSNFDADYCYSLGHVASLLVKEGKTGYMALVQNLKSPVEEWEISGLPITSMMHIEERKGKLKPVIKKALVDLEGAPFLEFSKFRESWKTEDDYHYPGPIQFFGSEEITEKKTLTLNLERRVSC